MIGGLIKYVDDVAELGFDRLAASSKILNGCQIVPADADWLVSQSLPVHPFEQRQLPGIVQHAAFLTLGPLLHRFAARRGPQPLLRHGHEALHAHMLGAVSSSAEHAFAWSLGAESAILPTSLPARHASFSLMSAILVQFSIFNCFRQFKQSK